jgi:hypothetical protein
MNIFVLDNNPKEAAQHHCDKHVVKMILESAQLLSTAHRIIDGEQYEGSSLSGRKAKRWKLPDTRETALYQATHINHPCAVWCRETNQNYIWLYNLFIELMNEYTHRYSKLHKCAGMIPYLKNTPANITKGELTEFQKAMPEDCKVEDAVQSYRNYYIHYKNAFARWTNRNTPYWYITEKAK